MANLKGLLKDTAIYGLSSIVGRFLNYLLVPLWTYCMPRETGDYGVTVNFYGYTALLLTLLTFGMETTLFRFANKENTEPDTVFSNAFAFVGSLTGLFLVLVLGFSSQISAAMGYADHPEYLCMMAVVTALDVLQALPFAYLRFQKRPIKFASLKLLFIVFNIALNALFFGFLHRTEAFYVFVVNLAGTSLITFFFIPDLFRIRWHLDGALFRRMFSYAWPMLLLGIAGILNQAADKIVFPLVCDAADAKAQLGEYGACVKIAMIMAMITQAFRFAYEPIVFAKSKDRDSMTYYADAMKWFVVFTLAAFLAVMALLDVLQFFVGADYRAGLRVVPIVMAAEIMMGIYFNLSFWYKLIDQTIWGAWFSGAGCLVLLAINVIFIPEYGYMACAWGGFAGYAVCMLLSYFVGQRKNPIPYDMKGIGGYVLLAAGLYAAMVLLPLEGYWGMAVKVALLCVYMLPVLFSLRPYLVKKSK